MITVTWLGPFSPGAAFLLGTGLSRVSTGDQITVNTDVGAGMLAADESWWSAVLDGGSATSTFTDGIDGGTSRFVGAGPFDGMHAS